MADYRTSAPPAVSIACDTDRHRDCPDGILACDCACHVLFDLEGE